MEVMAGLKTVKTDLPYAGRANNFFVVQVWRPARYGEMGSFCYFYGDPTFYFSPDHDFGQGNNCCLSRLLTICRDTEVPSFLRSV